MEKIILYSPFIVITLYVIGIVAMLLYTNGRNTFFEAHKESSDYSWTRVAGTFLISSAIVIAFAQILGNKEPNIALISSMIAVAIGGKVVQKRAENGDSLFTLNKNKDEDKQDDETIIDIKEKSNESEPIERRETEYDSRECTKRCCENCDTNYTES